MSPILACYNEILSAFSLIAEEDGLISQKTPLGTLVPIKIEGRRLVLPTKDWQRRGYGVDYQPFHPGCEVMSREGTSPVLQMLQRQTKAVVSHVLVTMATGLLKIAADKDTHKDLPLECTKFLKKLSNADKNTLDLFTKLLGAAVKKNRLLTVYLKNGGVYDGKKVNRSAIIRFPFVEDLKADTKDTTVLGVTIPKKQRPTLIALFDLIIPNGDKPEEYSYGTTLRVAPYLVSLLTAYHKVATVFNELVDTYADKLNLGVKRIDLYDMDIIDRIVKHYVDIPAYSGNEGSTKETPEEASETSAVAKKASAALTSKPKELAPQITRSTASTQVVEEKPASKSVSMADFMNATQPQQANNNFNPHVSGQMNTSFAPVRFQDQQHNFNPGFNNSFSPAPVPTPNWMGGGNQQFNQQAPQNPFMQATMTGRNGGVGNTGLV